VNIASCLVCIEKEKEAHYRPFCAILVTVMPEKWWKEAGRHTEIEDFRGLLSM